MKHIKIYYNKEYMENIENINIEKFKTIILDFINDLSLTFPEYVLLWNKWNDANDLEYQELYKYCVSIYPERFFDILYQNDEIFTLENESNTLFLPNVEFKMLFNCENVSEKTKNTMWKYLQLILITIVNQVNHKSIFGETANLFEGVDEELLQEKLTETIEGLTHFFKNTNMEDNENAQCNYDGDDDEAVPMPEDEDYEPSSTKGKAGGGFPDFGNMGNIHEHLKTLFDGKIGKIAKDIAEDFSEEIMDMFKGDENVKDTKDIFKKLMHNPKKLMELFKSIGSKINEKMSSGDISKEEVMKEASEIMSKMKGMGDMGKFEDIIKNMANMKGFGGKNMKFNANAFNQMKNSFGQRERMKSKLEKRNEQRKQDFVLEKKTQENGSGEYVFKLPEEGLQPKSQAKPAIHDNWLDEPALVQNKKAHNSESTKPKKKKNKNKK
jgi:hypothetical protein